MELSSFDKSKLTMSILMTPDKANFSGNVHGGEILKYLDQVAYACASRYCGNYVVTISVDRVIFSHPIKVGTLVTFLASINYTGKTSMEVGMKVISEDIQKGIVTDTNSCFFTMVSVDADGKPLPIPQLDPKNEIEKRRMHDGKIRRDIRLHGVSKL
jgi:acyl-CoA hydrolase